MDSDAIKRRWRIGPLASVDRYHTSDFVISNVGFFVAGYLYATTVLWYPTCAIAQREEAEENCMPDLWSFTSVDSATEFLVVGLVHGMFNLLILTVLIIAWCAHNKSPLTMNRVMANHGLRRTAWE